MISGGPPTRTTCLLFLARGVPTWIACWLQCAITSRVSSTSTVLIIAIIVSRKLSLETLLTSSILSMRRLLLDPLLTRRSITTTRVLERNRQ